MVTVEPRPSSYWRIDPYYLRPWDVGDVDGIIAGDGSGFSNVTVVDGLRVCSLERLLWVGGSDTRYPTDTNAVIRGLARAIATDFTKVGVLAP